MKKVICLLLCFCIFVSLSACKKEKEVVESNSVESFAVQGKIPECDYTLGDDPEVIKSDFSKAAQENEENYYFFDEETDYSVIDNGVNKIFYKTKEKYKGVSYIVVFDIAYGFSIGTDINDLKKEMKGIQFSEEELNESNAFFMKTSREGKVLKYKFSKNTVMFIFDDDRLCATAIYTKDWE